MLLEKHWVIGSCRITCTTCAHPSLQQKENRELSERLSVVEKTHSVEREKQNKEIENLRKTEQEARAKAETLPSLLEQLSFLQHELEGTRREKEDLEVGTHVYREQIQQVGLLHNHLTFLHTYYILQFFLHINFNHLETLDGINDRVEVCIVSDIPFNSSCALCLQTVVS